MLNSKLFQKKSKSQCYNNESSSKITNLKSSLLNSQKPIVIFSPNNKSPLMKKTHNHKISALYSFQPNTNKTKHTSISSSTGNSFYNSKTNSVNMNIDQIEKNMKKIQISSKSTKAMSKEKEKELSKIYKNIENIDVMINNAKDRTEKINRLTRNITINNIKLEDVSIMLKSNSKLHKEEYDNLRREIDAIKNNIVLVNQNTNSLTKKSSLLEEEYFNIKNQIEFYNNKIEEAIADKRNILCNLNFIDKKANALKIKLERNVS